MSLSLVTFIVSGSLIVLLVGLKMIQLRFGFIFFIPKTRDRLEQKLHRAAYFSEQVMSLFTKKTLYILIHMGLKWMRTKFNQIQEKLEMRSRDVARLIRKQALKEREQVQTVPVEDK